MLHRLFQEYQQLKVGNDTRWDFYWLLSVRQHPSIYIGYGSNNNNNRVHLSVTVIVTNLLMSRASTNKPGKVDAALFQPAAVS